MLTFIKEGVEKRKIQLEKVQQKVEEIIKEFKSVKDLKYFAIADDIR